MSKRPETHTFPEGVITEPLPGEVIHPLRRQQKTWSDIMHFNRNLANILAVGGTLEQIYRRWQYFDIISTPFGSEVGKNKPGTVTQDRVKIYIQTGWFSGAASMRLAELYDGAVLEHDEDYYTALINCDRELILPLLREDEQLREELIWGMLAVEGNRDVSLTQRDSYKPGQKDNNPGWSCALIEATETGLISRDRLIDALLSSLMSDFPAYRVGWFSRLVTGLKLTAEEIAARQSEFLTLFSSPIGPSVTLGVQHIHRLWSKNPQALDATAFAHAAPAVCAGTKANTLKILTMLQALYREGTLDAAACEDAVVMALSHAHAQVQAAALKHLEEWVQAGAADDASADAIVFAERACELYRDYRPQLDPLVVAQIQEEGSPLLDEAHGREGSPLLEDGYSPENSQGSGTESTALTEAADIEAAAAEALAASRAVIHRYWDTPVRPVTASDVQERARALLHHQVAPCATPDTLNETELPETHAGCELELELLTAYLLSADGTAQSPKLLEQLVPICLKKLNHWGLEWFEMRAHMTVLAAAGKLRERAKASEMTPKEDPGTVPNLHYMYSRHAAFFSTGFKDALGALKSRQSYTPLATPELFGGWVHPDTLVRRYAKNLADGAPILRQDFTAALLRVRVPEVLPPYATDEQRQDAQSRRAEALTLLESLEEQYVKNAQEDAPRSAPTQIRVLRSALDGTLATGRVNPYLESITVSQREKSWGLQLNGVAHGASTPELNAFRGLATAHHDEEGQYALLYPSLAEPLAYYCASSNWYILDHSAFDRSLYLALAAHPGVWGPACAFVFASGFSEQRVEIRSLAVEIMHRVLDDQLSLEDATAGFVNFVSLAMLNRWALALTDFAQLDARAAVCFFARLIPHLDTGANSLGKLLGAFSQALATLDPATRAQLVDEPLRAWLGTLTGSSQKARYARNILNQMQS
ncbi:DUF6493 family protein [Rothia mucilaginosa]|uniref:DUF6493 family protein n=1 Tax=Rothia mucilaginosa TaxID=43675 RepID=UPI0027B8DF0A|nr:DUF6493 family protein [Rothia mucilaginosa]